MKITLQEARAYIQHLRTQPFVDTDALLRREHKLTTDQQNLIELISAAKVVVTHLDTVVVPKEMESARDRLRAAITPCDIAPKRKLKEKRHD